jgi:hypothetical protein
MKNSFLRMDERNVRIARQVQSVLHTFTSLILVAMFVYRHNVMGQAFEEIWDIGLLMVLNGFFMCCALLFFGGIPFAKFKLKFIVLGYLVFVLLVFLFKCVVQFLQNEQPFSLSAVLADMPVIVIICGLIAGIFMLFAYLGKHRVDRDLD